MRYDYFCYECGTVREREAAVAERDNQACLRCDAPLDRLFNAADIVVPGAFGMNMRSLMPTYDECAAVDKRNDDYLNRPKEPTKATFEECLEKACVENRVDPRQLAEYQLKELTPHG